MTSMKWPKCALAEVAPAGAADLTLGDSDLVWYIGLEHIESNTGVINSKSLVPAGNASNSTVAFDTGNVLYSKLRPYLNRVVVPDQPGLATTELLPLRPERDLILREYLACYLRSPTFVSFASRFVTGAKMPRVMLDKFWAHELPLPPLPEQRRIVEILGQADHIRRQLAEADANFGRIQAALLAKAFSGSLTATWREEHMRELSKRAWFQSQAVATKYNGPPKPVEKGEPK